MQVFRNNLRYLRYVILAVAIVIAVITPTPTAKTTLMFMAPMVAVYFVSVWLRRRPH
jgi:Sec-independent protein secretion pathway component TatC